MERATELSRVGACNLSYPRTSRIINVTDNEVCCDNSYVNFLRHKCIFGPIVISHKNSSNSSTNYKHYLKSRGIIIQTLHVLPWFILAIFLLLPLSISATDINAYSNGKHSQVLSSTDCNDCFLKPHIHISGIDNLTRNLQKFSNSQGNLSMVLSIEIERSNLGDLNLSEFYIFPKLESITVTNCNVSKIEGPTPGTVINLNISSNAIKHINASSFISMDDQPSNYNGRPLPNNETSLKLRNIDMSNNLIAELPENIFQLRELETLRIFGNPFRCDFVWEKFSKYIKLVSNSSILVDADEAECGVFEGVYHFHYSILGVLKAKKTLDETCATLDKEECHGCELHGLQRQPVKGYPIIHKSKKGSIISISLSIDCSSRNLTEMPDVPLVSWELNVSNNHITDLSPLKTNSNYSNLVVLEAENNEIDVQTLIGSPFLNKFSYLGLSNNRITSLPVTLLASIKNITGQGQMTLGDNYINCDCDTEREVKPILIMLTKRIRDVHTIYCHNMQTAGPQPLVKDLQYADVCIKETVTNEFWLYILIATEVLLIIGVITKVWHDQRIFRRTGVLPWCSAKMPRLPCDAMLESLKDHPNHNNNNGHQQLQSSQKEMRSGSSCTTGKSSRSSSAQSSSV